MTDDERKRLIDGFRQISFQYTSGGWEYGYTLKHEISEYRGFIRIWKSPNYRDGAMHWNIRNVLRFKLYKPNCDDYKEWKRSLGDYDD